MDVVVTVPKNFTHPSATGKRGLAAWLAEGDAPGSEWSGTEWMFTTWGRVPNIKPGERVYVVCEGRLVGWATLIKLMMATDEFRNSQGPIGFVRGGGAVACTIDEKIDGFRGWKYRWWNRGDEKLIQLEST
jgi:hypothetical protein